MKTLRETLISAISAREATIRNGRCRRKDLNALRAAMGRAWVFLSAYPTASDDRVKEWCRAHHKDVAMIVPGNSPRVLARLIMEELAR